ncbi:MAG TPA: hypothetical protein VGO50_00970 [Pyrinomonadaceae bacterium]|nr:hypothetical protein [Pyrinomonadaceae bacterium]
MKIMLAFLMIAFLSLAAAAQDVSADKSFAANIKKFKVEKYSVGEDASSGYDYLVYKQGTKVVKIRTIWSSSANPKWWVEDAYYESDVPVLFVKLKLTKRQFKSVVRGSQITLPVNDKFYLKDAKLVKWIENGKAVPTTDTRWPVIEKEAFMSAKDALEFYPELKEL